MDVNGQLNAIGALIGNLEDCYHSAKNAWAIWYDGKGTDNQSGYLSGISVCTYSSKRLAEVDIGSIEYGERHRYTAVEVHKHEFVTRILPRD
jgi:hypothetical protein